jgi:hypothetical protein
MTTSHFGLMILFAAFVSVVFAVLSKDALKEQLTLGVRLFGGFVGAGLLLAWLLYPFPL